TVVYRISQKLQYLKVLHSTLPMQFVNQVKSKDFDLELIDDNTNEQPEFIFSTFKGLISKYKAAKKFKSQRVAIKYPLIIERLFMPFEYYTTKFDTRNIKDSK